MLSRSAAAAAAAMWLLAASRASASASASPACHGPDQMVVVIPTGSLDPPFYSWKQCAYCGARALLAARPDLAGLPKLLVTLRCRLVPWASARLAPRTTRAMIPTMTSSCARALWTKPAQTMWPCSCPCAMGSGCTHAARPHARALKRTVALPRVLAAALRPRSGNSVVAGHTTEAIDEAKHAGNVTLL